MWLEVLRRNYRILSKRIASAYPRASSAPMEPSIVDPPADGLANVQIAAVPPLPDRMRGSGWIQIDDVLLAVPVDAKVAREIMSVSRTFLAMHRLSVRPIISADPVLEIDGAQNGSPLVGSLLRSDVLKLQDAWFADTHGLRMKLCETSNEGRVRGLRAFQLVPGPDGCAGLRQVCAAGLESSNAVTIGVDMANPLMPLLLVAVDAEGLAVGAGLFAFPALSRGGLYHGEVRTLAQTAYPTEALLAYDLARLDDLSKGVPALRAIVGDHAGATGAEPLYSAIVAEWLMQVFGLSVLPKDDTLAEVPALHLPPDCLPTVAVMVAQALGTPKGSKSPASHVVCDDVSYQPLQTVVLPLSGTAFDVIQTGPGTGFPFLRGNDESVSDAQAVPLLALRYRRKTGLHPSALLLPRAIEQLPPNLAGLHSDGRKSVLCHLQLEGGAATERMLRSLLEQTAASRLRLLVTSASDDAVVAAEAVLSSFEGGWQRMHEGWDPFRARGVEGPDAFAGLPSDAVLVKLSQGVVLHDPRTVELLVSLAQIDSVGMAGCVSLAEMPARRGSIVSVENGGYFPTHVSLAGGPTLVFSAMDTLDLLPNATYPVVAPPEEIFAVRVSVLREAHRADPLLPGGAQPALQTGLVLTALGRTCLCTSAVRALTLSPPAYREAMDPVTLAQLPVGRWQDILSRVTLIQRVA